MTYSVMRAPLSLSQFPPRPGLVITYWDYLPQAIIIAVALWAVIDARPAIALAIAIGIGQAQIAAQGLPATAGGGCSACLSWR